MNNIPAGYWQDAEGRLIPEAMVKPIDQARDVLVKELAAEAQTLNQAIAQFKARAFADIAAFIQLSAEEYGVKLGGKKGNASLSSFDGRLKIDRQVQEYLAFDERLQAAKVLIDECIQAWSEGSRDEIKTLINDAFRVNQQGRIDTNRVLGLKNLGITDEKWLKAMAAISDSIKVTGSKSYIRFYERVGDDEQYRPISLDIASL